MHFSYQPASPILKRQQCRPFATTAGPFGIGISFNNGSRFGLQIVDGISRLHAKLPASPFWSRAPFPAVVCNFQPVREYMFREKETKSRFDNLAPEVVTPLSEFTDRTSTTPKVVVPSPFAVSRRSTSTPTVTPRNSVEPGNDAQTDSKRLMVGRGISLNGKISSCDRLIIEGNVEAELENCRTVEVAESGTFKGAAEIAGAEISGRYEGSLTVRETLLIRATGRVSGTVRYGRLQIEDGGEINGDFKSAATTDSKIRSGAQN